jgi:hypothetical protein
LTAGTAVTEKSAITSSPTSTTSTTGPTGPTAAAVSFIAQLIDRTPVRVNVIYQMFTCQLDQFEG